MNAHPTNRAAAVLVTRLVQLGLHLDLIPVSQSAGRATPVVTGFLGRRAGVFLY